MNLKTTQKRYNKGKGTEKVFSREHVVKYLVD